jgi:tryptophan synthase alpha chain
MVFAGFGISKPEQAKTILQHVDGIIIGSAFVELIEKYGKNRKRLLKSAEIFINTFLKEVNNAGKK